MLEVLVEHVGDSVQFEVKARKHKIYCDQPIENGGFDEGMTPPELLLAALGTCAGYYAAQYLKAWNLSMDGLWLRTTAEKAAAPARISKFHVEIHYPRALEQRHRDGVLASVRKCLIHNTLLNPPKIVVSLRTEADALVA